MSIVRHYQNCVRDFHLRNGYPSGKRIDLEPVKSTTYFKMVNLRLELLNSVVSLMCKLFQGVANRAQKEGDPRLYRALLHLEEAAEVCDALSKRDDVALADGLGDLAYVTYGTADCYSIPMYEVFTEIHEANMSKKVRTSVDPRMRDKGNWSPPDIHRALMHGRNNDPHYSARSGRC